MSKSDVIEIDRIILEGLDLDPTRAETIRSMLELELQDIIARDWQGERMRHGISMTKDLDRLDAGELNLAEAHNDNLIARNLAVSIADALKAGLKSSR